MFLLSTWLCFVLFAVCDAAAPTKDKFGNNVTNWNDVTGKAMVRASLTKPVSVSVSEFVNVQLDAGGISVFGRNISRL